VSRTREFSSQAKTAIIDILGQHYEVERLGGQSLFRLNSRAVIYVRFSKDLGGGKFYFGVGEKDFKNFRGDNFHVLFVCGHPEDTLVLPADVLAQLVGSAPVSHGQWKLNVLWEDGRLLLQVPGAGKFDVTEFKNHFDFSPPEWRGGVRPEVRQHIPLSRGPRAGGGQGGPAVAAPTEGHLHLRLKIAARESGNPKALEEALSDYFEALGFVCRRIGGPGETDVLIEQPVRIVVDGKSTKAPSVSHINFTRIKQHRAAHDAEGMLVVSVGFQPAVVRDAVLEQAGLVAVDTLNEILAIHERLPVSPLALGRAFSTSGLIDGEAVRELEEGLGRAGRWLERAFLLIENTDFEWRSLDELRGRVNFACEQLGQNKFAAEDLKKMLDLLGDAPFDIFEREEGMYRCTYYPRQAKQKVFSLFHKEGALSP